MYFVDGPCGSAKTYAAVRHAHYLAGLGNRVLFVQPSIFLINQTVNDVVGLTPEVRFRAIHGKTSERVIADIIAHSKHSAGGEILFITHSALMLLPYFHRGAAYIGACEAVCHIYESIDTNRRFRLYRTKRPELDGLDTREQI